MPVNEGSDGNPAEEDRLLVRQYVAALAQTLGERVIAEGDQAFRADRLAREAQAADHETLRERMIALSHLKRGRHFPGSRPYQRAGFKSRAEWEAAGSPDPTQE